MWSDLNLMTTCNQHHRECGKCEETEEPELDLKFIICPPIFTPPRGQSIRIFAIVCTLSCLALVSAEPPANGYPPSNALQAPGNAYLPPSTSYGVPSSNSHQYQPRPTNQYLPPNGHNGHNGHNGQSTNGYHSSQASFQAPSQQYGAPSQQYGAPSQQYGAPSQQYGAPSQQYGAPAFNLPSRQYGAPQQSRQNYEVEVTRENVEYAGTVTENPENPPADEESDDSVRVQGVPTTNAPRFNPRKQQSRLRGQFTDPQEFEVARNFQPQPQGAQQQFGRQQAGPQREYGAPATRQQSEEDQEDEEPSVVVAKAASSGQYYVLSPDNTLQRVMFLTRQTEEDRRRNGFTAQLRYSPVQPITDPVYVYNEQGQLVRVFNK
ncbi:pro-resilin-like [Phlebotomus argentipes]|uniref:pro-resilin-like n=1 Tax=Phlebotomus argentipes TaxID=94469 RepID=UPI0028937C14|nr:pro-resilin-like [Phlebotomus argentipes]